MRFWLLLIDFIFITLAWLFACYLVLDSQPFRDLFIRCSPALPILYLTKIFFFVRFGLYRAILRYASFHLATTIVKATTIGSLLAYLILNYPQHSWPFSPFVIDWLVTIMLVGAIRFLPRYFLETHKAETATARKALIYGAGDLGEAVARGLLKGRVDYKPIGFIDDDTKKIGRKVHNLPILGDRLQLGNIVRDKKINELIIAINHLKAEELRNLIKECRTYNVFCRMAPKFSDMLSQDVYIKNIDIADLLKRDPQDLDERQIDRFLRHKKILITGAAGSIGQELVRQSLRFNPKKLIMLDHAEHGLYQLEEALTHAMAEQKSFCSFKFVLLDLLDQSRLNRLIQDEKPDIVFHAAAYKHVPIIEDNPFSGVINNVQGSMNLANAAHNNKVEKFVMISTDKAVRPTSVMGASKRICELYIQNLNLRSDTEFVAVRFGNVLGSSGSVVPKFLEQIRNGGPVTVTHPDVTRYFMLTQEAVQLVMQAASIGHGGEIFILNMGNPVQIKEMAENLIFLAGKEPYKDIDIKFTGLRPGEKLYEELLIDEAEKKTQYENITIGKMTFIEWAELKIKIERILASASNGDRDALLLSIKDLEPAFIHLDLPTANQPADKVIPLRMIPTQ